MNCRTWLRLIVIGQWCILVIWAGVGYFESRSLPRDLQLYIQRNTGIAGNIAEIAILLAEVAAFTAYLISTVAIVKARRWSRRLFFYSTVSAVILSFFTGPHISGPVSNTLNQLGVLLMGMTLGLLYFSPLEEQFD